MVAFLVACDDSASAGNNEPTTLSSADGQGSSSSEKLSETSSGSADKVASSSSVVTLANPCKTETEDNCEYGTVLDDRDGQTYKTVKIGDQWWMAENLNYAYIGVSYNYGGYTSDSTSWCYDNNASNCTKYGRLYTWAAAMDSVGMRSSNGKGCGFLATCSPTYPVRGVCPEGWHLPDTTEWKALLVAVGGRSMAGKVLKSTSGWMGRDGNGTDAYSFSALPVGERNFGGGYYGENISVSFWSSSELNGNDAYNMFLYCNYEDVYLEPRTKLWGGSVRCVKD